MTPLPSADSRSLRLLLWAITIVLAQVVILAVAVWLAGCGGGGRKSPRQPVAPVIPVTTQWGSLSVEWACPGVEVDRSAIEDDVARAYLKGEAQDPRVAGLRLDGAWALFGSETNPAWNGHHDWLGPDDSPRQGSRIFLRCPPSPSALAHELFHRFAHQLDVQCDRSLIDHPGGYTLSCAPIPAAS